MEVQGKMYDFESYITKTLSKNMQKSYTDYEYKVKIFIYSQKRCLLCLNDLNKMKKMPLETRSLKKADYFSVNMAFKKQVLQTSLKKLALHKEHFITFLTQKNYYTLPSLNWKKIN